MKKICFYSALFYSQVLFAQINLVPNPSFEDTVSCPHFASQIDKAVGWHTSSWTPDYFHECDWLNGTTSVPSNYRGYQFAQDGLAYTGIGVYSSSISNFTESFTCQLLSPLNIGKKYNISFYLSVGDLFYRLTCNMIGTFFSTVDFNVNSPFTIQNYAQLYTDSVITDTANWVLVSGRFIADSAYTFMTIGRVFSDSLTSVIFFPPAYPYAYYYIDAISLTEDTALNINENPVKHLTIYPNPTTGSIAIKSGFESLITVNLIDYSGRKFELIHHDGEIDLSNFPPGLYLIELISKKTFSIQKIQKL
ncbi:MAG: T9SS type A sorting domain-containing protein [Bacteroidia bacterium]|nr:T9SS type A sorting domain-containing protein [Bacteroidia bacterium]